MSLDLETSSLKSNAARNIWFTARWRGERKTGELSSGRKTGFDKLFNLSRGLSWKLQVRWSRREMMGRRRSAGEPCRPASPAPQLCDLELVTHPLWPLLSCLYPDIEACQAAAQGFVHLYWLLWALAWLLGCWFRLQKRRELGEQWFHVLFFYFFRWNVKPWCDQATCLHTLVEIRKTELAPNSIFSS